MDAKFMIEMVGYLGSALVVVSMLMGSVVKLRVINTVGSIIFAVYALIIKSYPTALMNFCLVSINIYHLMRLRNTGKHYSLVKLDEVDGYLAYLLKYYWKDIKQYFPEFSIDGKYDRVFGICCDSAIAGVLIGRQKQDELEILLDYTTPVYRDCSAGKFLYEKLPDYGIKRVSCEKGSDGHVSYLEKMGFVKTDGVYKKKLTD